MQNLLVCTSLIFVMGTGLFINLGDFISRIFNIPHVEAVQEEPPELALDGYILMTDKGPLDISEKGALFIYPDVGSRDVLRVVKELPEEKRPYIIINSGTIEQAEQELKEVGLTEEYYICRGESPADVVPSLYVKENRELLRYTCSMAVEKLTERKYPMLVSSAVLENTDSPSGHNAIQAAKAITEAIVQPGEEFSFYSYVGVCSVKRGYKVSRSIMRTPEGPVYFPDVGGGICRTSTLLNFAVKDCPGLKVTERHNHSMPVSYATPGEDTAVARSSGWDYRFVNNREKPVQIIFHWDDNNMKVEIWEMLEG